MKIFKIIGLVFLALLIGSLSLGSAFAITTTGFEAYWTLDNTTQDKTGNGYTLTNVGSTSSSIAIINSSYYFDGNDRMYDGNSIGNGRGTLSWGSWVKTSNSAVSTTPIIGKWGSSSDYSYIMYQNPTTNQIACSIQTSSGTVTSFGTSNVNTDVWTLFVCTYDGNNLRVWTNNSLQDIDSQTGTITSSTVNLALGKVDRFTSYYTGYIDEPFIFYGNLTQQNITNLYNSGSGLQYPFSTATIITIDSITANGQAFTNNSIYNTNQINFTVNISTTNTNNNTNLTYYLYNSTDDLIENNTYSSSINYYNFSINESDGDYKIYFYVFNNQTNVTSFNYSFTIDTQPANVSVNAFTEWNNGYNVTNLNTTLNITCEDANLDYCEIHWDDNTSTNIGTTQYKVFATNGNHTFSLHAHDLANNTKTVNGTIFINPYQYFRFNNTITGSLVSDYEIITSAGTYDSNGTETIIPLYDLGLGTHDLNFTKFGFVNQTFQVTFNTTSAYNTTYNITPVTLSIQMFDADNTSAQITFDVTILNSTTSQIFTSQTNFSKTFSEIPTGDIEIIVESSGYSTAYYYQTLTPYTSILIIGYLVSVNNTDVVTFQIYDKTTEESLGDVLIEAQQLINGTYTTISQAETGDSGQAFIFLDITKVYKFIFTKDGYVQATSTSIPGVTTYTVRLQPEGSEFNFIDGVSYSFAPSDNVLYDGQNYTLKGFISSTGLTQVTYTVTLQNGTVLYTLTSNNPTGSTFSYNLTNLNSSAYTQITTSITYIKDGTTKTVSKIYRTTAIGATSFIYYLKYDFAESDTNNDELFRWLVMLISIGGSLLLGRKIIGTNIIGNSIVIVIVIVTGFFSYIEWLPPTYFGAISVAAFLIFLGGRLTT